MDAEQRFVLVDLESEIAEEVLETPCSAVNPPSESKPNDPMPVQNTSGKFLYNNPNPFMPNQYTNPSNALPSTSYGTFPVYPPLPPFPILPPLSDRLRSKEYRSLAGVRSTVFNRYSSKDSRLRIRGRKKLYRRPAADTDGEASDPEEQSHTYYNFSLKLDEQKEPAPSTSTQTLPSCQSAAPTSMDTQTTQNVTCENTNVPKNFTSSSTQTTQNVSFKKGSGRKNLKSSSTQTCHCPGKLPAIYSSGQTATTKPPVVINVDVRINDHNFKDTVKAEEMRLDKSPADQ